ncbi:MAG: hypothetical protein ACRDRH_10445 [Pseudonocardia sp.]
MPASVVVGLGASPWGGGTLFPRCPKEVPPRPWRLAVKGSPKGLSRSGASAASALDREVGRGKPRPPDPADQRSINGSSARAALSAHHGRHDLALSPANDHSGERRSAALRGVRALGCGVCPI